jgi:hypothetical protein
MSPTLLASLLLSAAAGIAAGDRPATAAPGALAAATAAPAAALSVPATPASLAGPAAPAADPCAAQADLPEEPACGATPLCSARRRVALACAVREALEHRYVFWTVKGALLGGAAPGFDARRHVDACITAERLVPREEEPLRFEDRLRRCLGAFQDGHLIPGTRAPLPKVALGIELRLLGGRVYVAGREERLLAKLAGEAGPGDLSAALAVGTEVVEIDGAPVQERLDALAALVPGSSAEARRERAVDALTFRDFAYPERRTAALTVIVGGARRTVELPWWLGPGAAEHPLTRGYARRTGIPTTDLVAWRRDPTRDPWRPEAGPGQGTARADSILPPAEAAALRAYRDEGDRVAVRLGEVRRPGHAFCYLQILTFQTETLAGPEGQRPFPAVLDRFVGECRDHGLDLVVDLRQNGGGFLSHTSALAAALAPRGGAAVGAALLLRATDRNQLVYQARSPVGAATPGPEDVLAPRRVAEAIGASLRARAEFAPAFVERPAPPSAAVGGYDGRVVALVAPTCMSACDRLAAMLKAAGRATLVGAPTEGAGGSQQEATHLSARWSDPDGLFTLSIPNAAMGVARPHEPAGEQPPEAFFAGLALENRPVQPDIRYEAQRADLLGHNAGWLEQAEAALSGPAATPPAPAAPGGSGSGALPVASAGNPARPPTAARAVQAGTAGGSGAQPRASQVR